MTGKIGSGQMTGKSGGRTSGIDPEALADIKIVNGDIIITKRGAPGTDINLGKSSDRAQELITHSLTVPVGNGEVEITHNLNTKSIMYQVFDSSDNAVEVPSIRELNKIKFFFGTTSTEATYTVVLAN